jgi:DNA repair protein RadC
MNIKTAKRNRHSTYRFIVTSVVSEGSGNYKNNMTVDTPEAVVDFWNKEIKSQPSFENDKENLVVVLLNARLRAFAWNIVSIGALSETTAHPREILRPCIAGAAHSFVLIHNHPSGFPEPSWADELLTKRIKEASELMQIKIVDHIIIGNDSHYSFRESGLL